jgi:hypothetical protein
VGQSDSLSRETVVRFPLKRSHFVSLDGVQGSNQSRVILIRGGTDYEKRAESQRRGLSFKIPRVRVFFEFGRQGAPAIGVNRGARGGDPVRIGRHNRVSLLIQFHLTTIGTHIPEIERDSACNRGVSSSPHQGQPATQTVTEKYDSMRIGSICFDAGVRPHELDSRGDILYGVSKRKCATAAPGPTVAEEKNVHARPSQSLREVKVSLVARQTMKEDNRRMDLPTVRQVEKPIQARSPALEVQFHRAWWVGGIDLHRIHRDRIRWMADHLGEERPRRCT